MSDYALAYLDPALDGSLAVIHDSGEVSDNQWNSRRTVTFELAEYRVRLSLRVDSSYPAQGFARLELWREHAWSEIVFRHGMELLDREYTYSSGNALTYKAKPFRQIRDSMLIEAARLLEVELSDPNAVQPVS